MAIIDVSQAQAGMILAADILDMRGRVLIPAGAELKDKHVRALPAWGVSRVDIKGDDVTAAPAVEPWAIAAAAAELEPIFSLSNRTHPAIAALLTLCTQRAAARIQAAQVGGQP